MATRRNRRFVVMVLSTLCIITSGMVFSDTNGKRGEKLKSGIDHPLKEMLEKDRKLPKQEHVPGEILVKVKKGSRAVEVLKRVGQTTPKNDKVAGAIESNLERILKKHGAKSARQIFKDADVSGKSKSKSSKEKPFKGAAERSDLGRWYHIKLAEEASIDEAMQALADDEEVESVEANGMWRLAALPNASTDPGYAQQWHFEAANIVETWQHLSSIGINPGGRRDVVVAVVDTGVDYTHEDLVGNMWINSGEIPRNGIDDDGNGFIDDFHGCSVIYDPTDHSGDPMDLNGHGTHVAGIVAATAFNNRGGVGVAYNVQIMAVRASRPDGLLTITDISEGVLYAADHGADVINMSFGGYGESLLVQEALAIAFSQAVLVAAAGNDDYATESKHNVPYAPQYPAAYNWVVGVMAMDEQMKLTYFTNYDPFPGSRYEYELAAPGRNIYSTLPGNKYEKWSGTSMAAPVVSGAAALIRSALHDKAVYSSRYIMSQLVAETEGEKPTSKEVEDVERPKPTDAITEVPKPLVVMLENWVLDNEEFSNVNNGDGEIDAGETIHLGIQLRNNRGYAKNISCTVTSEDPFVSIQAPTIAYSNLGPLNINDNGFEYDGQGVMVGIRSPFIFTVDPMCPNGYGIMFSVEISFRNEKDLNDNTVYRTESNFSYIVRRGQKLPTVIEEDMDLTSDRLWIVGGVVRIEAGATVRVHPGTHIQWGSISDDIYSPGARKGELFVFGKFLVEGTYEEPVYLYPSDIVPLSMRRVDIHSWDSVFLKYVKAESLYKAGDVYASFGDLDHCYFTDYSQPGRVDAFHISNSIFHRIQGTSTWARYEMDMCLKDGCQAGSSAYMYDCTYLADNENNHAISLGVSPTLIPSSIQALSSELIQAGYTYVRLSSGVKWLTPKVVETVANFYGGHIVSIHSDEENDFIKSNFGNVRIGLNDEGHPKDYRWLDGTEVDYVNWEPGYPRRIAPEIGGYSGIMVGINAVYIGDNGWKNSTDVPSGSWILKIPGEWSNELLHEPRDSGELLEYVIENHRTRWYHNAFLSKYWDLDTSHWFHFTTINNTTDITEMYDNYWGTDSTFLIDHAVTDYQDTFQNGVLYYSPPPSHGFESTYPFAESVSINGKNVVSLPEIGAGTAVFTVKFNRNMNPAYHPFVTFGPAFPYTDFVVRSSSSSWIDPNTWQGTAQITPMTGEGYHLMRVSGAVAADDPWLVTGYDVERFRFRVATAGVSALTLQASGEESQIQLTWLQDDYDLLAGYNLYRSTSANGTYEKINETIIPVSERFFTDKDITPAVAMYYKFTVLQTDLRESGFSNVASAAAVDTIPPVMTHVPVTSASAGLGQRLTANVTDNLVVSSVKIFYRSLGSSDVYASLAMVNITGNEWSATISGSIMMPPGIEYYLVASDGGSQVYDGTPAVPHLVTVINAPALTSIIPNYGPASGGTEVTLTGNLFQEGASVLFDNMLGSDITLLSSNQITCTTPAHFPATVDVTVINPDDSECILLKAFHFEDRGIVLSMPITSADYGTVVELDLSVSNVTGMRATDVTILFDASVLGARSVRAGTLTAGWSMSENIGTAGRVTISLANATAVSGTGSIARITFEIVGTPPASTALTISSAVLNDGAIEFDVSNGSFDVNGFFAISGTVSYFGGGYVPGVGLTVAGAGSYSDVSDSGGDFSIGDIPTGSYSLRPSKIDDANEITAYDASLVLQSSAGLLTLSGHQTMAADVNRNGMVNAMDASYILEKSVELRGVPFPGAGEVWAFDPGQRDYPLLNSNQSGQNFTGVLIGDVSGNWQAIVGSPLAGKSKAGSLVPPVRLSLGDVSGGIGERIVVPMEIVLGEAELYAANLTVTYDATRVSLEGVVAGSITEGMAAVDNTLQDGQILIGLAGSEPLTEDGILFEMSFRVLPGPRGETNISISVAQLNEGTLPADVVDGSVTITVFLGDIEPDGDVDVDDFGAIAGHWGREDCDEDNGWCEGTDFAPNGADGAVNFKDIVALAENWLSGVVW